ncbi:hypothetical protein tb265_09130 [Gemmatimonadetes bacterium T265]|nr:hypothetical protein tb265_09130 [Gemmatimonadetes bacterium T265]
MAVTTGTRTRAKTTAKTAAAKRTTADRTTAAKKPAAKKSAAKKPAAKSAPRRGKADPSHYTQPELREQLKDQILAGDKGGRPGQWSARKAQLLAHAYEAAGGGYKGGKSPAQRHLDAWTHEEWTTADGKPAIRGKTTARYLPKQAWEELTPAERRSTDKKKRAASKTGRQFVANTAPVAAARRGATATKTPATKSPTRRARA